MQTEDDREDPGFTPLLLGQSGLALVLWCLLLNSLQPPADPATTLGLALLGAALEVVGVAWPGMGFSSSAPACYLALALLPGCPVAWAALGLALGISLRSLSRGGPAAAMRVREATASALPVLLTLVAAQALRGGGSWLGFFVIDVYLPAAFLLPAWLAAELSGPAENRWRKVRARTVLAWLSTSFLAPPLAALKSLWLVPVLFGLQRSSIAAVEAVREEEGRRLSRELEGSRRSEQRAKDETALVRRELEVKVEERVLFEELARQFAQAPDLLSTCTATVQMALRLVPSCCSAALFVEEEGRLVPVAFQSPQRKRLESSRLLQLEEPIVAQAWREQREVGLTQDQPERLFLQEAGAVALPIAGGGVLYVGSPRPGLSLQDPSVNLLRLLVAQAGEALQAAARYQSLHLKAEDSTKLRAELSHLSRLLEASLGLSKSLEVEEILTTLETHLEALASHHSRALVWSSHSRGQVSESLLQIVVGGGHPLLIEDVERGKIPPLQTGERSLLAIPLDSQGAILLGHKACAAFTRDHLDSLRVLAIQATLALHNAQLHQQIRDALAKLTESEAQLVQSSKMAAVGQLAAGVAHELNTPLGAMMLAIQGTLRSKAVPDPIKALLQRAEQAGDRARDIVQKLLYYSRDARVGRRRVQLHEVVQDTLDLLGQQFRLDGIQVVVEDSPVGPVLANQNELQQVLTNLLMNARDALLAAPDAPRQIRVVLHSTASQAGLDVCDQGPGIDPEVQARIFDPFFTTKPVGKGTGLGLSVSQQLIESHDGTLSYEPQPVGSLFRVMLPLAQEDEESAERTEPGAAGPRPSPRPNSTAGG